MRANERRMRLIEELCERKFYTIDNLAFELGVSRRTICYDIEELSLSYPIFTAKGTGGGVWVRDGYRLGRRYLTEKQRELLERLSAGLTAKDAEIMESILSQFTLARGFDATLEKPLKVDVKYAFNSLGGDISGYSVKVVPHAVEGKDFDFTLDGQAYSFQAETNLTGGFDIEYGEESFTVTPKGGVDDVLKGVYPNNEIGDCEGKGYADMYSLVITSYNGEATVTVHFSAYEEVCEITLDKEVIVF